jgi:nitrate reductase (cytochrome), electron transfer subunit
MKSQRLVRLSKRATHVFIAIVAVTAASGYFMGIQQNLALRPKDPTTYALPDAVHEPGMRENGGPATISEYSQLKEARQKANSFWTNSIHNLAAPDPDFFPTNQFNPGKRLEATAARMERRAYEGAPPVIPHHVEQNSSSNCLSCHGQGAVIQGRTASKISHAHFSECLQCHVPSLNSGVPVTVPDTFATNSWKGRPAPGTGERAYQGSPPVIPHRLSMREDCMSCHGPLGSEGLRTTHPYRNNCLQCHAIDSTVDQNLPVQTGSGKVFP